MVDNQTVNQAANQAAEHATTQPGFLAKMKDTLRFDTLVQKIKDSRALIMDIALYGGLGFLSGFLLRKYSAYIAVFVLFIVSVILLQQFEVISIAINWTKVNELFGIQPGAAGVGDTALTVLWEWVKANLAIVVSYIIGFLIGLRMG
jgi:uncharacterized membrane protein (Fun14 family)